jgi:hypothetical protein
MAENWAQQGSETDSLHIYIYLANSQNQFRKRPIAGKSCTPLHLTRIGIPEQRGEGWSKVHIDVLGAEHPT